MVNIHCLYYSKNNSEPVHILFLLKKNIPCSWKYWLELNLAVGAKISIAKILADLNLAVAKADHQLPNLIPRQIYSKSMYSYN